MRHVDDDAGVADMAAPPLDYAGPASVPPRGRGPLVAKVTLALVLLLVLLVAVLLPMTGRARPGAVRIACAANLRGVGQSVAMYANAHGGAFPDTLEQAVATGYVPDVRIFCCPGAKDTPATGGTPAAEAADLVAGGHLSYAYVGGGLTLAADRNTVIAYEHATNHEGQGGNVLFADGHAEWFAAAQLRAVTDWHAAGNGPQVWRRPAAPALPATRAAPMQPVAPAAR
jgi:prepilin-type processing-associated H-X9-DG protein